MTPWCGRAWRASPGTLSPSGPARFRGHQHSALVPRGASYTQASWTGSWSRSIFLSSFASLLLGPGAWHRAALPAGPSPALRLLPLVLCFAQQPGRRLRIAGDASCLLPGARSWPRGRAVPGSEVGASRAVLASPTSPSSIHGAPGRPAHSGCTCPCQLCSLWLASLSSRQGPSGNPPGSPACLSPWSRHTHICTGAWGHWALRLVRPTVRRKGQFSRASR